jgi:hypothetical protein
MAGKQDLSVVRQSAKFWRSGDQSIIYVWIMLWSILITGSKFIMINFGYIFESARTYFMRNS